MIFDSDRVVVETIGGEDQVSYPDEVTRYVEWVLAVARAAVHGHDTAQLIRAAIDDQQFERNDTMTDIHTADTDHRHDVDAGPQRDVPASLTIKPPAPRKHEAPRAWPLTARLAVAVLIIGLATVATMSLIALRKVSVTASNASQQAASEKSTVTQMGNQLTAIKARVAEPIPVFHLPAVYQHYGICVSFDRNSGNGDLVDVNLTSPQAVAGQFSCGQGSLVSVVPQP